MLLFGEKYGNEVLVLDSGTSRELCGGTHVKRTGDIGYFKIVMEGGVPAGIRRVEAVTGLNAMKVIWEMDAQLSQAAQILKAQPSEIGKRIAQVQEYARTLEKELAALKSKQASSAGADLAAQALEVGTIKVLAVKLDGADANTLRQTMDQLKAKLKSAVIVLATVEGAKVQIAAGVTLDLLAKIKAGDLVNFVAQQVGGKGGGKPDMAMAGGTDAAQLPAALISVKEWVQARV